MIEFFPGQYLLTLAENEAINYLHIGRVSTDMRFYVLTNIKSKEMCLFERGVGIIATGIVVEEMVNRVATIH